MPIKKFQKKDTKEAALLIMNTYKKFNGSESIKKEAAENYIKHYNPTLNSEEQLLEIFRTTPINYVFIENNKIIGIIRGRSTRIVNLFVDEKHHRKGIGRKLVLKFENEARKQGTSEIKIRSSIYATHFYEKMGYKKTTGIRNFRGLKVFPMKKFLK